MLGRSTVKHQTVRGPNSAGLRIVPCPTSGHSTRQLLPSVYGVGDFLQISRRPITGDTTGSTQTARVVLTCDGIHSATGTALLGLVRHRVQRRGANGGRRASAWRRDRTQRHLVVGPKCLHHLVAIEHGDTVTLAAAGPGENPRINDVNIHGAIRVLRNGDR